MLRDWTAGFDGHQSNDRQKVSDLRVDINAEQLLLLLSVVLFEALHL